MGDRCGVYFQLAGKIKREHVPGLIEHMLNEGLQGNTPNTTEPTAENLHENFYADEVNYGTIDAVTDYCLEHQIAFELTNGAGGGYGAGIRRFDGVRDEQADSGDWGPMVAYSDILKVETLATGLATLIADARFWAADLEPVEIVDV